MPKTKNLQCTTLFGNDCACVNIFGKGLELIS